MYRHFVSLLLYPVWRIYYHCKFWLLFNVAWKIRPPKAQSQLSACPDLREKTL
jgi:hypothetical protein